MAIVRESSIAGRPRSDAPLPPTPLAWRRTEAGGERPRAAATLQPILRRLDAVAAAPTILEALRAAAPFIEARGGGPHVAWPQGRPADELAMALLDRSADPADRVTAIAAAHALARVPGRAADEALVATLEGTGADLVAHVAWASDSRPPAVALVEPLVALVARGGLAGMHAQATLARWSRHDARLVAAAIRRELERSSSAAARRQLVETLGLVGDRDVLVDLERSAIDPDEPEAVRIAAIGAFGDRAADPLPTAIARLSTGSGPIAAAVELARRDRIALRAPGAGASRHGSRRRGSNGVRIAQLHLGAELDPHLLRSGAGTTGGIATLLVGLGRALLERPEIDDVVTIGRGSLADHRELDRSDGGSGRFVPVPLGPDEDASFLGPWPARVAAERGISRIVRGDAPPDVLHLRMADVGSLAGARIAADHGIRMVFTLAPDPHGLIAAREAAGALDRRSFGSEDARGHLWYRARLVERLAAEADHVVMFPRERLAERLRELVDIDIDRRPERYTLVPEGVDVRRLASADAAVAGLRERRGSRPGTALASASVPLPNPGLTALAERLNDLPPARRRLPIVISVGRLHEVKGMARLVRAFAADEALRARSNLVIVGGDLAAPSVDERAERDRIRAAIVGEPDVADAVVLLGHRPNRDIGFLLAAARRGLDGLNAPHGAYVCASEKEEFGLAIVEALATGLPVVAPRDGGPPTYVEEGVTGVLVETRSEADLARGIQAALDLAVAPRGLEEATDAIRRTYDTRTMAGRLAAVYAGGVDAQRARMAS